MITLKTLPQATAQEVFDQVKTHLLTQMQKCNITSGVHVGCKYRLVKDEVKLACAAGCLISDEEYELIRPDDQAISSWSGLNKEGLVPDAHFHLVHKLQYAHDQFEPAEWEEQLLNVAIVFDLEFS